ncbi:hypothetical protein JKP88DRAFT_54230 [Tribonema minus]|uniref:Oxidoreductase FAD/NAD(P)-binding domain-containing protein n=1 Tax=Tribonema minus TaxID=303371 RepID=A0A835YXH2_9STRA|nr:hypothetical protein JKP88DRAFT_54230 [Tribonema minus]
MPCAKGSITVVALLMVVGRLSSAFTAHSAFSSCAAAARLRDAAVSARPRATSRQTVQCNAWATEVEWKTASLVSNKKAADGLYSLTVDAGEISTGYKMPGQYVQIKTGDEKAGFYAIASAPKTDGMFEFLVKETDTNKWLTQMKSGTLDMSAVMGNGFPIKEEFTGYKYDFPVQNVILVATGTGIAPIRAAIESGLLEVDTSGPFGRSCTLYYGAHSPERMAYQDKLEEWESKGMTVVPVMSAPAAGAWNGRTGFVQKALGEDGVRVPRNTGALLCGQKEMVAEVKDILGGAGVFAGRQLLNF